MYHDDNKIFDERGNNGTVSSSDGDVFLVYTNTDTTVVFFSLRCDQDGIYSFIINSILLANASIVVKRKYIFRSFYNMKYLEKDPSKMYRN